jgi:hypothetical protein
MFGGGRRPELNDIDFCRSAVLVGAGEADAVGKAGIVQPAVDLGRRARARDEAKKNNESD